LVKNGEEEKLKSICQALCDRGLSALVEQWEVRDEKWEMGFERWDLRDEIWEMRIENLSIF
jgi:hypothetical protein